MNASLAEKKKKYPGIAKAIFVIGGILFAAGMVMQAGNAEGGILPVLAGGLLMAAALILLKRPEWILLAGL